MREHAGAVYSVVLGFARGPEADDLAQDVFLRLVQGLPGFQGQARLSTWVHRVATNVGLNHLRGRRRRPPPQRLAEDAPLIASGPGPARELDAREEREAFRRALEELPPELRAVVVLRVHRGLPFQEIASVLEIPRPTAESRMARAKERLRARLRPHLGRDAPAPPGRPR